MSATRPIRSIIVFVCLLISVPAAMASYPWDNKEFTGAIDCDWSKSGNWSPPGVPGPDDFVVVMPGAVGPCITGSAQCSTLSLNPWDPTSWGAQDTIVTVTETALDVNFGAVLQINSQADYDSKLGGSELVSRAIVNVYGGTVTTPYWVNFPNLTPFSYGITIGGGSSTYGDSYGILNMYGGLVSVPQIAIYYGDVNLYGGTLECTIAPAFVIQDRPENRINVNGGTLKLQGNNVTELNDYITNGRIVCIRGGELGAPVYDGTWTTLTGANNFNVAWGPQPANNATNVHYKLPSDGNSITLSWQQGDLAKQHDVYFGTSFANVNSATTESAEYKGSRYDANGDPCSFTIKDPNKFTTNTSYYWRIDETNDSNVLAQGLVWTFKTHDGKAYSPKPVNAGTALSEPLQLSWAAGDWANLHYVFFGSNLGQVQNANTTKTTGVFRGTVSSPVYPLSRLAEKGPNPPGASFVLTPGVPYYWRIDEVNTVTGASWSNNGTAWAFTPAAYINIDDFEDYSSTDDVNANWPDHYAVTGCSSQTGNAGRLLVRDATGKYLSYTYNNGGHSTENSTAFSEAKRPYSGGTSFTGGGIIYPAPTKLRIDYKGTATNAANNPGIFTGNDTDQMYVAIEDAAGNVSIYLNPDHTAQRVINWTSWYIALTDINALGAPHPVNLNAITGFAIGFGQRCNNYDFDLLSDADSVVMFDNIRLVFPACNPLYGPSADFTGDCYVGLDDLVIMAQEWLIDNTPCSGDPCTKVIINLVADLNHDGTVDFKDFAILENEWRTEKLWP